MSLMTELESKLIKAGEITEDIALLEDKILDDHSIDADKADELANALAGIREVYALRHLSAWHTFVRITQQYTRTKFSNEDYWS
jgi:hypothetical protein